MGLKATSWPAPTKSPCILRQNRPNRQRNGYPESRPHRSAAAYSHLTQPLSNGYDPATLAIRANVVAATHGETVEQLLGSGDALAIHQQFELSQPRLTTLLLPPPAALKALLVFG